MPGGAGPWRRGDRVWAGQAARARGGPQAAWNRLCHSTWRCQHPGRCRTRLPRPRRAVRAARQLARPGRAGSTATDAPAGTRLSGDERADVARADIAGDLADAGRQPWPRSFSAGAHGAGRLPRERSPAPARHRAPTATQRRRQGHPGLDELAGGGAAPAPRPSLGDGRYRSSPRPVRQGPTPEPPGRQGLAALGPGGHALAAPENRAQPGRCPTEGMTQPRAPRVHQRAANRGHNGSKTDSRGHASRRRRRAFTHVRAVQIGWSGAGSNRRPSAFQADARTN